MNGKHLLLVGLSHRFNNDQLSRFSDAFKNELGEKPTGLLGKYKDQLWGDDNPFAN